jgi:hypothetical protein
MSRQRYTLLRETAIHGTAQMNLTSPEDTKQEEQNTDVPLVTRTAAQPKPRRPRVRRRRWEDDDQEPRLSTRAGHNHDGAHGSAIQLRPIRACTWTNLKAVRRHPPRPRRRTRMGRWPHGDLSSRSTIEPRSMDARSAPESIDRRRESTQAAVISHACVAFTQELSNDWLGWLRITRSAGCGHG